MKNKSWFKKHFRIILLLILFVVGVYFIQKNHSNQFFTLAQSTPENQYISSHAIPDTNVKWFMNKTKARKDIMTESTMTYTVEGEVVVISQTPGNVEGDDYHYLRSLVIKNKSNEENIVYFSPRRTQIMRVIKNQGGAYSNMSYNDITAGDYIEIEESVDLLIPNFEDQNVLFLTLTIKE